MRIGDIVVEALKPSQYIKNPSEPVQLAAVKKDGRAIQYIENPSNYARKLAASMGVEV